jgi:hypothetical protein
MLRIGRSSGDEGLEFTAASGAMSVSSCIAASFARSQGIIWGSTMAADSVIIEPGGAARSGARLRESGRDARACLVDPFDASLYKTDG